MSKARFSGTRLEKDYSFRVAERDVGKVFEVKDGGLSNVEVVQEGLGVSYRAVFFSSHVMLVSDPVVPVHALGQKSGSAVTVSCYCAKDCQSLVKMDPSTSIFIGLEVRLGNFGILPHVGGVPRLLHGQETPGRNTVAVVRDFKLSDSRKGAAVSEIHNLVGAEKLSGHAQDAESHGTRDVLVIVVGVVVDAAIETAISHEKVDFLGNHIGVVHQLSLGQPNHQQDYVESVGAVVAVGVKGGAVIVPERVIFPIRGAPSWIPSVGQVFQVLLYPPRVPNGDAFHLPFHGLFRYKVAELEELVGDLRRGTGADPVVVFVGVKVIQVKFAVDCVSVRRDETGVVVDKTAVETVPQDREGDILDSLIPGELAVSVQLPRSADSVRPPTDPFNAPKRMPELRATPVIHER